MTQLAFQPLLPLAGFQVGHHTDTVHGTGTTVVLCPEGCVGGVDVRGGAPGTRETALLDPACKVDVVHGVSLSGGSAFGLGTADGVMRWLAERGFGYDTGTARVPIVPGAIIYDLSVGPRTGNAKPTPTAESGYAACENARPDHVLEGCVGAGIGATVGKFLGMAQCTKGGVGGAALYAEQGLKVGALVVVNALGNIGTGARLLAGARDHHTNAYVDIQHLWSMTDPGPPAALGNTTIGAVLTNAQLTKAEMTKVAQMAHSGISRTIQPSHTPHDGDTLFALATGEQPGDPGQIGTLAALCVAEAIVRAVQNACSLFGIPAASDVESRPIG